MAQDATDWLGADISGHDAVHVVGRALFSLELRRSAGCISRRDWVLVFRLRRAILDAL